MFYLHAIKNKNCIQPKIFEKTNNLTFIESDRYMLEYFLIHTHFNE